MAEKTTTPVEATVPRAVAAMEIVKKNVVWSVAAGLLPMPLLELAAITGVQLKLIKELADYYGQAYRKDLAKSAVVSLLGGLGSVAGGNLIASGSMRLIPVIGPLIAVASLSAVSAAVTYAVGKIFISHFETGGTLLDFDPEKVREFFREEFQAGMKDSGGKSPSKVPA
jgi:uncharacterized protein (DUF697 family)